MAEVSLMLAKYAYIDAALKGDIDAAFYDESMRWIRQNIDRFKKNKYLTRKLKLYNILNMSSGGLLYKVFRKYILQ